MRFSAIRVWIWAFVAVILIAVLALGINSSAFGLDVSGVGFTTTYSYPNSEAYTEMGTALPADTKIDALALDWIAGEIDIRFYDGDQISFYETATRELEKHETLRYLISNGKLTIRYCEPRTEALRTIKMPPKSIKILIPKSLSGIALSIDNISSSIYVDGDDTSLRNLVVESVSGDIKMIDMQVPAFTVSSISGSVSVQGMSTSANIETISGGVALEFLNTPRDLHVESISGSVAIKLPDSDGFTATLDSVSGKIKCDAAEMSGSKKAVYGNGKASFSFSTISGSVTIDLLDQAPAQNVYPSEKPLANEELPTSEPNDGKPVSSGSKKF